MECAMGPVNIIFLVDLPLILGPGPHIFQLEFTTDDALYHVGAFYELNLIFDAL